ncbi:MAG: phage tail protein [Anaerovibrio sp.]|uniref:phage tail protein n=1 Tax=Anaerovibrio sp. TaxID=1872532 RepID=UPI0025EF8B8F|nr:phage tail protein [Anaerovibrio sp.]MCR5175686.1 phage tail protein [Anaerovibrio sp.]
MNRQDYCIADRLPESLNRDNLREVAQVIDEKLHDLDALNELICLYPRIDELSSELVDALAIHFHVDFYDTTLPLAKRKALVKNSIKWHMRKGTKGVVKELIATVFDSADVEEWFDYSGEPYHFRVNNIGSDIPREQGIDYIITAINSVKNTRSWLDGLNFTRSLESTLYYGAELSTHKKYVVGPAIPTDQDADVMTYAGAGWSTYKKYEVGMKIPGNQEADITPFTVGAWTYHKKFTVSKEED